MDAQGEASHPQTPMSPSPGTAAAAAAMATLYPSLEDMKGHQLLQVSISAAALGGGEQTPTGPCGVPPSEGPQGRGAQP